MNEQDPRDSKCWTCKFGHCISQTQREVLYAEMEEVEAEDSIDSDDFDLGLNDFDRQPDAHMGHVHQVEKRGMFGLCYWTPYSQQQANMPVHVQIVHECNRYESRDAE